MLVMSRLQWTYSCGHCCSDGRSGPSCQCAVVVTARRASVLLLFCGTLGSVELL